MSVSYLHKHVVPTWHCQFGQICNSFVVSIKLSLDKATTTHVVAAVVVAADVEYDNDDLKLNNPITMEEVVEAVQSLKKSKAAGPDVLIGELFNHSLSTISPFFGLFF